MNLKKKKLFISATLLGTLFLPTKMSYADDETKVPLYETPTLKSCDAVQTSLNNVYKKQLELNEAGQNLFALRGKRDSAMAKYVLLKGIQDMRDRYLNAVSEWEKISDDSGQSVSSILESLATRSDSTKKILALDSFMNGLLEDNEVDASNFLSKLDESCKNRSLQNDSVKSYCSAISQQAETNILKNNPATRGIVSATNYVTGNSDQNRVRSVVASFAETYQLALGPTAAAGEKDALIRKLREELNKGLNGDLDPATQSSFAASDEAKLLEKFESSKNEILSAMRTYIACKSMPQGENPTECSIETKDLSINLTGLGNELNELKKARANNSAFRIGLDELEGHRRSIASLMDKANKLKLEDGQNIDSKAKVSQEFLDAMFSRMDSNLKAIHDRGRNSENGLVSIDDFIKRSQKGQGQPLAKELDAAFQALGGTVADACQGIVANDKNFDGTKLQKCFASFTASEEQTLKDELQKFQHEIQKLDEQTKKITDSKDYKDFEKVKEFYAAQMHQKCGKNHFSYYQEQISCNPIEDQNTVGQAPLRGLVDSSGKIIAELEFSGQGLPVENDINSRRTSLKELESVCKNANVKSNFGDICKDVQKTSVAAQVETPTERNARRHKEDIYEYDVNSGTGRFLTKEERRQNFMNGPVPKALVGGVVSVGTTWMQASQATDLAIANAYNRAIINNWQTQMNSILLAGGGFGGFATPVVNTGQFYFPSAQVSTTISLSNYYAR